MYRILVTYGNVDGLEKLINNSNFKVEVHPKPSREKFINLLKDYHCLLVRSEVKVDKEAIDNAPSLKFIGRAGTGVDNIDIVAATQNGIVVVNVPAGNTISAAEHTFGLLLALSRNIPKAENSLKSKKWEREKFVGVELCGKVLGIIGLGRVGGEVAKRALSFGMKVIGYDPFVTTDYLEKINIVPKSFDELLKESDFITLHVPLTDSTRYMINKETIKKMKKEVRMINTSRGSVINEEDLYEALKNGDIAAAALDVFEKEPLTDSKLFELDNIILTPHLGASTEEAQIRIGQDLSQQVIDFFEKGIITNAVNSPSIDLESYERLKPYLFLSEKMGKFHAQLLGGGLKEIILEYCGEIINYNTNFLTIAFLKGILSEIVDTEINFVNAFYIAKERKIKIKEIKTQESEDYISLIISKVKSDSEYLSINGTVFSRQHPRIINLAGLAVDVFPEGHLLVVKNEDRPGMVGKIGTVLGENQINIASMEVGRKETGGEAITILNIDSPINETIRDKIKEISGIVDVKSVNL